MDPSPGSSKRSSKRTLLKQNTAAANGPDPKEIKKEYIKQLNDYFNSPFKSDKVFVLEYLSQITREKMSEHEDVIDKIFYDGIYNVLINPNEDPWNIHLAFDILGNMIESPNQRQKLGKKGYLKKIFSLMDEFTEDIL